MEQVKEAPTEGQFVAIWVYDNKIWSGIFRVADGVILEYRETDDGGDAWEQVPPFSMKTQQIPFFDGTQYFVQ